MSQVSRSLREPLEPNAVLVVVGAGAQLAVGEVLREAAAALRVEVGSSEVDEVVVVVASLAAADRGEDPGAVSEVVAEG